MQVTASSLLAALGAGAFLSEYPNGENALVIHGVPHRLFWFVLRSAPALLSHTAWIGWGAGVANPWKRREAKFGPLERIWFSVYEYCVPRLAVVSTQNTLELGLLESMVGPLDSHIPARYLLQGQPQSFELRPAHCPLKICVGHRAGASISDYERAFESLGRFADRDIEIHVPLSYGHHDVVPTVIEMGQKGARGGLPAHD